VRLLGTIAMSSNAYALRARFARPISMSLTAPPYPGCGRPTRPWRGGSGDPAAGETAPSARAIAAAGGIPFERREQLLTPRRVIAARAERRRRRASP
jgi:hypothetical protein